MVRLCEIADGKIINVIIAHARDVDAYIAARPGVELVTEAAAVARGLPRAVEPASVDRLAALEARIAILEGRR